MPRVYAVSLGCDKNRVDTEVMLGLLTGAGYRTAPHPEEADVILVNTCGFIATAQEEAVQTILEMARYRNDGRPLIVAGCLAQRYTKELRREIPEIDALVGTGSVGEIVEIVRRVAAGERGLVAVGSPGFLAPEDAPRVVTTPPHTAFLKIAEGCSNACAYCVIPRLRGAFRSRQPRALLREAAALARGGVRELILVAQDTTRYGSDLDPGRDLAWLLRRLAGIDGLQWLRLLYCYPNGITPALVETLATEPKVCRYLDIPMQHASDAVLARMGRATRRQGLERLVEALRRDVPGITLRSTFMVGFPGETEADFEELLDFLEAMRLERAGFFAYSREEGTRAAAMADQVAEDIKRERLYRVQETQLKIMRIAAAARVGTVTTVLTDARRGPFHRGRTEGDAPGIDGRVYFGGEPWAEPGEFVRVRVVRLAGTDLVGWRIAP
ncbi:MAG: 30S ribosomal protein S12 methylthiotransferase RimO [Thermoanaerobacterales bacterium]|nr:30S ribosomal protein S12 methylthiotransferase RimO [Bacillota bacterium]MDI6906607.1 30S ribosomal protein S12 methylthiotransferase RimO [Thermoanaerobacterales bacterium]